MNSCFDSWVDLCEYVCEVAEMEASRQMHTQMLELADKIADEIIATAEEYEPEASH